MYSSINQVPHTGINQRVRYQDLMEVFKQLAMCVQNDQTHCAAVLADTKDWINFYRRGVEFEVKFVNVNNISEDTIRASNEEERLSRQVINAQDSILPPLPASTNALSCASRQNRKRSSMEIQRTIISKNSSQSQVSVMMSQTSIGSNVNKKDAARLPDPNLKGRNCKLCRGNSHGQFECPKND